MLLDAEASFLLVIDVQKRLAPAMDRLSETLRNIEILMRAAARLAVPMVLTEQYPKGLGHTVDAISELATSDAVVEKISFSALGSDAFGRRLAEFGRRDPVICGIEAHVCVLQSALDLQKKGPETATGS